MTADHTRHVVRKKKESSRRGMIDKQSEQTAYHYN